MFKKKREENVAIDTIIGNGTSFSGRVVFEEALRIDGHFEGEIQGVGMLVVGQSGAVKADNIDVMDIFIGGSVEGNVSARGSVQIASNGSLKGNISYGVGLTVEEGGVFEGNSRRVATHPMGKGSENLSGN
ncbi:MAG: polymer-forming cytoskeletal protein [Deltaproteobacteria bacterium]|nr:polymer-forming cytoskeletal protein [Deltaproteobacteria bacterium]